MVRSLTVTMYMQAAINGGIERWTSAMLQHCCGVNWRVCCVDRGDNLNPYVLRRLNRWAAVAGSWEAAVSGADIVITATPLPGPCGAKVIAVSHGSGDWTTVRMMQLQSVAKHYVAVSRQASRACPKGHPVTVIENGVDVRRCTPRRTRSEVRTAWGLDDSDTVIGYVGRLMPDKRVELIADAVKAYGRRSVAVFVGDHGRREDLSEYCRRLGIRYRLPGAVEHIGNAYGAFDVAVCASPSEGYSLAAVEAMAAGCPLITTNVGIIPDLTRRYGSVAEVVPIKPTAKRLAASIDLGIAATDRTARSQQVIRGLCSAERMACRWDHYLQTIT